MRNSAIIGKFGEAQVIVDVHIPHDTILISPKEESQFLALFELLEKLRDFKTCQEHLAEPIIQINAAMAKYKASKK